MEKYVYLFSEGNKDMRELLGGKGANLAEMSSIGLPVPRGFTITTDVCHKYLEASVISDDIKDEILEYITKLENITGKRFGDSDKPLLVSVRSGAPVSMPGMMDTILNLGLNDTVAEALVRITDNPRFVYDSYRRFVMMFSDVVMGLDRNNFEDVMNRLKKKKNIDSDLDLDSNDMKYLTKEYKKIYKELLGQTFPDNAEEQLLLAIEAVFRSWNNERAIVYRRMNDIPSSYGTAVNVQEMVYGNYNKLSGTGVAFTRNPSTGEHRLYGEYLINAQGEDVVAGVRTPQEIDTLRDIMPNIYEEFVNICKILENHYKDMQDMEFTIEDGKLFMLQTRSAKRTGTAAVKIAYDMVNEGLISKEEALLRVDANSISSLLHDTFAESSIKSAIVIGKGLAASPGAGVGKIYFSASSVADAKRRGEDAVLVRSETSPEDISGMKDSVAILTVCGGMTSHAAVVARGMGKCCVTGCSDIIVDLVKKTLTTRDNHILHEGDYISVDGGTGNIYLGKVDKVKGSISAHFKEFMEWADSYRTMDIRCNADTRKDAEEALKLGANGIGLCRTEHMFFSEERILNFRKMIVANNDEERKKALEAILPYQRQDFEDLFEVMNGKPVIIRYLDPPLHEFLPKTNADINKLAGSLKIDFKTLSARINSLKEFNPMMGHRGCRLAVTYPMVAVMQTKAVIEACINVMKRGIKVTPEIMIPLVGDVKEFNYVRDIVVKVADKIIRDKKVDLKYKVGTMIEVPRACLESDKIAEYAEFYSFGTNDLTQLTYGFSRDDASKFIETYLDKGLISHDPFASIDTVGVGELVKQAIEKAKKVNKNMEFGVCGEHGGDVKSIEFFNKIGLDYVSSSPYRVPIARLAAAQAAIKEKNK